MSATVCGGKRPFIDEQASLSPSAGGSKRLRLSASPGPCSPLAGFEPSSSSSVLGHLSSLFPDMDMQILERAWEECGNDLNSVIRRLNEVRTGLAENFVAAEDRAPAAESFQGSETSCTCEYQQIPMDASYYVELIIKEMAAASSMEDCRVRVAKTLEAFQKSMQAVPGAEATESLLKENLMLKEQIEALSKDKWILKRGLDILHERQNEFNDKSEELQQLRQLISQYQERVRTLEVSNYALKMHLQQAQQSNSIPGRFHPDVF